MKGKYIELDINSIKLWEANPRNKELIPDESKSIRELFGNDVLIKNQKALAKDILSFWTLPNDLPIVVQEDNEYIVLEGNRRLAVLKCLNNPSLLDFDKSLMAHFNKLVSENSDRLTDLQNVDCVLVPLELALKYVERLHTSKPGVNRMAWGPEEQEYFFDFVVDDPKHKKTHAYHIINTHKGLFTENILQSIKFTTMNRVLGYSVVKDFFGIRDYRELNTQQIELINYYFELCIISEEKDNIKMSRFTVGYVREKILPFLKLKYDEIITRNEKYEFQFDKLVNIFIGEHLDIPVKVRDKESNLFADSKEIIVAFYDSDNNIVDKIDTSLPGTYTFSVSYLDEEKKGNIIIRKRSIPEIELSKYSKILQVEETLNLRTLLVDTKDIDIEKVIISNTKNSNAVIDQDLFTKDNIPGKYFILYKYTTMEKITITKTLLITVEKPNYDNLFTVTVKSVFSKSEVHQTNINIQINALIQQMVNVDFDNYYFLVASGYRSIIELSLHKFYLQKGISLPVGLENKITEFIVEIKKYISNGSFTSMCSQKNLPFTMYKNYVNAFDNNKIQTLVSKLNLATHSSGTMIPKSEILDLGRTDITELIMLFDMVI